jgi:type I restriction enzyme R subunit
LGNENIQEAARVNTLQYFMYFFEKMLEGLFIDRMQGNEEIFTKLRNDDTMMRVASKQVGKDVWDRLRKY